MEGTHRESAPERPKKHGSHEAGTARRDADDSEDKKIPDGIVDALKKGEHELGDAYAAVQEAAAAAEKLAYPKNAEEKGDDPDLAKRKREWTELSVLAEEVADVQDRVGSIKRRFRPGS